MNLKQHNMVSLSLFINCLFNMNMLIIQHKEHEQNSHDSYIRKPRLTGIFLGNEGVRINEVSLYSNFKHNSNRWEVHLFSCQNLYVFIYTWYLLCYRENNQKAFKLRHSTSIHALKVKKWSVFTHHACVLTNVLEQPIRIGCKWQGQLTKLIDKQLCNNMIKCMIIMFIMFWFCRFKLLYCHPVMQRLRITKDGREFLMPLASNSSSNQTLSVLNATGASGI